jgi:hypothetical protein
MQFFEEADGKFNSTGADPKLPLASVKNDVLTISIKQLYFIVSSERFWSFRNAVRKEQAIYCIVSDEYDKPYTRLVLSSRPVDQALLLDVNKTTESGRVSADLPDGKYEVKRSGVVALNHDSICLFLQQYG